MDKTIIVVDHREPSQLKSLFVEGEVRFENLHAGDFAFRVNGRPRLLIERKELEDLLASLVDGRFDQQKAKLAVEAANYPVGFIIEGEWKAHPERKTFQSVMMTTRFRDGFHVILTEDEQETVETIRAIGQLFQRGKMNLLDKEDSMQRMVRARSNHRVTEFSTTRDWWACALGLMPGIGPKAARAIARDYPDPESLMKAFSNARNAPTALQSVQVGKRKLGPSKAKTIWECFQSQAGDAKRQKKRSSPKKGRTPPPSDDGCLFLMDE